MKEKQKENICEVNRTKQKYIKLTKRPFSKDRKDKVQVPLSSWVECGTDNVQEN